MVFFDKNVFFLGIEIISIDKFRVMGLGSIKFFSVFLEGVISRIVFVFWKDLCIFFIEDRVFNYGFYLMNILFFEGEYIVFLECFF